MGGKGSGTIQKDGVIMNNVIRFPSRRRSAVFITEEKLGGFYVVLGSTGWLFPSLSDAWGEAQRIATRLGVPVRMEAQP